ncbi:MAG: hypothetical protein IJU51_03940, partial [Clostridia bacterium]|nr:hypothetical protein [Clostridia bacterium]
GVVARGIVCYANGLEDGDHTAVITVKQGDIQLDALEIFGKNEKAEAVNTEESKSQDSKDKKALSSIALAAATVGIAAAGTAAAIVIRQRRKKK